jgi:hypothetical protein
MLQWAIGGGQFAASVGNNTNIPGVTLGFVGGITSTTPVTTPGDGWAFFSTGGSGGGLQLQTINLGGNFTILTAGGRFYPNGGFTNAGTLITIKDAGGSTQCILRINGTGQVYFTGPTGATIGSVSVVSLAVSTWNYIEFSVVLSAAGAGTCQARINGSVVASSTGLTNAASGAFGVTCATVVFGGSWGGTTQNYMRDLYVVDGNASNVIVGTVSSGTFLAGETLTQATSGATATLVSAPIGRLLIGAVTGTPDATHNWVGGTSTAVFAPLFVPTPGATSYLGDIDVVEVYPNGPGVNTAWAANVGPFAVTNVSGSGSSWTFTGSWSSGASGAYIGYNFNTTSCGTGNNQSGVVCTASAAGSITLTFTGGSNQSGLTGSAAFQCLVQVGINETGTRPNNDLAYIFDSTAGDISDFAHETLNTALGHAFSGIIRGVIHLSFSRKDDAGSRSIAQLGLSSGVTVSVGPLPLGNTYQYWLQITEVDPNTLTQWGATGFNASTWGVKELT